MKLTHAAGMAALLTAAVAGAAETQFPTRPIRLLVPQAAGGSNDIMARNVANHLTQTFGKQVVVDNRPGAEGIIGTEIVARSAPDGYTLLLASAAFTMNPAVRKLPYDSLTAFDWVAKLGSGPTVLTVGPLLPVGTVKEILAIGKEKPGVITMASAGGFQHFGTALFRSLSGVDFTILLYKGGFPAMIDVMGGQSHMTVGSIVQSIPHIRSGKLKPIATGGATRAATLPDLPTIAEAGVPGYDASNWWAVAAPAGTPAPTISKLSAAITAYLNMPETQKRFTTEGAEVDIRTPAEMRKMIPLDMAKWARVAKEAGMRAE
ncbi:MAG TPA: tripartite tricarboxylate transporter substrate binding protein [Casimicrobiaceae bacterium]|nr:tripartite tricarboxylate transporter substrate binding protein [Casimicrobiaceae bacterium]